jgi:hypothetical protein
VRTLLRSYTDQRILFYETGDRQKLLEINANTPRLQSELWSAVRAPAATQATPVVALALSGINDVLRLPGVHAGCMVGPDPSCGLGYDGSDRHLRQLVGWRWLAIEILTTIC